MKRDEGAPLVAQLRAEGLTFREIGERLGIHLKTAFEWFHDPTGAKGYRRRRRWDEERMTPCVDCGELTSHRVERCLSCTKVWTRQAIVLAIEEWADENGGIPPTANQWTSARKRGLPVPAVPTVQKEFGSWAAAVKEVGLEPYTGGCYRFIPDEVKRAAVRDYLAGDSSTDVAARYDVSQVAVLRWVEKAGFRTRTELSLKARRRAA